MAIRYVAFAADTPFYWLLLPFCATDRGMKSLFSDRFIFFILGTLALAWVFPLRGDAVPIAQDVVFVGIFLLFFLHGLRLPRGAALRAAKQWRLQMVIMAFIFIAMPLAGLALVGMAENALPPLLLSGVIFLSILPSTVQSAVSYSSLAGGDTAASVMASALSNLAGVIITPLMAAVLLGSAGIGLDGNVILKVSIMLLLPFALGQYAQRWLDGWAKRQAKLLTMCDKGVILLALFSSFAAAVGSGQLMLVNGQVMLALLLLLAILLVFAFSGAMLVGGVFRFDRAQRISLLFAGSHKSIATGAPLAAILFGSEAGLILLPAICYHVAQLTISAPLAARLARTGQSSQAA